MDKLKSYDEIKADREFINEKIKKTKFRFLKFFNKAHNIVIYIRNLNGRTDYFRKLAEKMILMNNRTRWNSWYNIFQILFEQKTYMNKYYENFEREL
jgi:predicted nucleic acid-binding OB-fold protein